MAEDKRWQKNAGSQIVLDSIFAALAAVWVTFAIQDKMHTKLKFVEVVCSLLSFFLFASSAEGTTTAYDEGDVLKFVYYLLWYNIGVFLIGAAIGALILAHFETHVRKYGVWVASCMSPTSFVWSIRMLYAVFFVALLWRWIYDVWFLLCKNQLEFSEYLKELNDEKTPEHQHHFVMRLIFKRRGA